LRRIFVTAGYSLPERTYDVPYDLSKLQIIDCLRRRIATFQRYPQLDRTRVIYWGGSQGALWGRKT